MWTSKALRSSSKPRRPAPLHSSRTLAPTFRSYSRPSIAPKPILDIRHIAKNPGLYEQNCVDRNYKAQAQNSWKILELTQKRTSLQKTAREQREANNDVQKQVGELQRKIKDPTETAQIELLQATLTELLGKAKVFKDGIAQVAEGEKEIEDGILELALALPNLSSSHSPNEEREEVVKIAESRDEGLQYLSRDHQSCSNRDAISHVEIGTMLDILDFTSAGKSSGWGWYFLKNEAAMLEQALIQYTLSVLRNENFTITSPPSIVYSHIAAACGFQPRDQNDEQQIYTLQQPEKDKSKPSLSLAATAEIPLAGMHANHTFAEKDLPLRYGAVSRCYRAEAGARGVDTKGLYRVHEFTKVEMFAWTMPHPEAEEAFNTYDDTPLSSDLVFDEMLEIQERILRSLGLTFRILEMPSTDLGGPATRKRDMEVYFPGRQAKDGGWGEVTSTSICTDYQSRRLGTRVKAASDGKSLWPYTINGTALAVPRILAAILETHYDSHKRSVAIPEVLRPWMQGLTCIER